MSSIPPPPSASDRQVFLGFVDELLRWLCRLINNNLFFIFSVPLVFLLLRIPQIFTVISETVEVPHTDSWNVNERFAIFFLWFLLTVGAFCLASVFVVVPPHWTTPRSPMLGEVCARLVAKWNSGIAVLARWPFLAGGWPSVASWSFTVVGLFLWLLVLVGPHLEVWMRWASLPVLALTALVVPGLAPGLFHHLRKRRAARAAARTPAKTEWADWQLRLGRGVLWLLGGLFWLCLFVWAVPRTEGWLVWSLPVAVVFLAVPMAFLVKPLAGWLIVCTCLGRTWQLALGTLLLAASALTFFKGAEAVASSSYLFAGGICRQFGALFGFTGAWLLLRAIPWHRTPNVPYLLAPGRVLGWLFVVSILGECIWVAAARHLEWVGASYRLYTIWGVLQTAALVVVLGAMIDAWQRENHWAMRVLALVALAIVFVLFWAAPEPLTSSAEPPDPAGVDLARRADDDAERRRWYDHLIGKLESLDADEPAVFVAASGGGSRAAIFTALVLEDLARQPLGDKGKSWADHLVLISSVSGGSLANAYYVHALTRSDPVSSGLREQDDLKNSVKGELITRMIHIAAQREVQTKKILLDSVHESSSGDVDDVQLQTHFEELVKCRTQWEEENAPDDEVKSCPGMEGARTVREWTDLFYAFAVWQFCRDFAQKKPEDLARGWALRSAFVDAMCTDFMAPVIRGTLTPQLSRGRSLRHFWTHQFAWHRSSSRAGYDYRGEPPAGETGEAARFLFDPSRHPVALFNTCDARTGTRVVSGFPPLPPELLRASYQPGDNRRPRTLEEFDPAHTVGLADAVGLSANFPFGFNVVRVDDTTGQAGDSAVDATEPASLHLMDGGVIDNTGIDVIFEILRNVQKISAYANDSPGPPGAGHDRLAIAKCKKIAALLQTRRVVLLEIDSGAKPGKPGLFARYASVLFEPLDALNNAGYTNADLARKNYNDAFDRQFRQKPDLADAEQMLRQAPSAPTTQRLLEEVEKIEQEGISTYFHITYICNHLDEDNVLTAWSLSPNDKALLLLRFLLEHESRRDELTHFDSITNAQSVLSELDQLRDNARQVVHDYLQDSPRYVQLTKRLDPMIQARRQLFQQAAQLADHPADDAARKELVAAAATQKQSQSAFRQDAAWLLELSGDFSAELSVSDRELEALQRAAAAPAGQDRDKSLKEFGDTDTALAAAKEAIATRWVRLLHQQVPVKGDQKIFDQGTYSARQYFEAPAKR
jgi:hypothetical protein